LILDEATSSVDAEAEYLIQQALERVLKGRTALVIAHRLSTVRNADKIIALDRGRIVEVGSHEELMQRNGLYSQLYQRQMDLTTAEVPGDIR
jgi:ABC-type multidrug transport system fused ATPase/permease subunit